MSPFGALWILAGLVPLLTAASVALAGLGPNRFTRRARAGLTRFAPLAVAPTAALALWAEDGPARIGWLLLGTTMQFDAPARSLVLMACALYAVALASVRVAPVERAPALSALLLICFVGNAGVFAAADAVTFYLCFAVMSFVAYALVIHDRTAPARRAGRIYLTLTVLGESAVLAALLLTTAAGGLQISDAPAAIAASADRDLIVALLLVGFGVKAGTVPLHVWLPLAHPAAPAPASAVLSGAMITAGLAGWLRFLPLGEIAAPAWGTTFLALALVGAFAAVPIGVLQKDPKVILAYSSISQMGLVAALVGVALTDPRLAPVCISAAVVYAVHHGLAKGALFLGVPLWKQSGGRYRIVVIAGLSAAALSLAGAPLTAGYAAKYAVKDAVGVLPPGPLGVPLELVLTLVGTGSTVLLLRAGWVLLRSAPRADANGGPLAAWLLIVAGALPLTVLGPLARAMALPVVPGDPAQWWSAAWPILTGLALAALAGWSGHRGWLPEWMAHPDGRAVPPGDTIVFEEAAARRVVAAVRRGRSRIAPAAGSVAGLLLRVPSPAPSLARAQAALDRWTVSGALTILLLAALAALALAGSA